MIRALALMLLLAGCATDSVETEIQAEPDEARVWCNTRIELARTLKRDFDETSVYTGLTLNGLILEIFAPPDGRTFSLVMTHPIFNRACVVYAGFGWKARALGMRI